MRLGNRSDRRNKGKDVTSGGRKHGFPFSRFHHVAQSLMQEINTTEMCLLIDVPMDGGDAASFTSLGSIREETELGIKTVHLSGDVVQDRALP